MALQRPSKPTEDEEISCFTVPSESVDVSAEDAMEGIRLFFTNKFDDAETHFSRGKDAIPIFAVGFGFVSFVKAMMTFERSDIREALSRLNHAERLASYFTKEEGRLKRMAKFMIGMKRKQVDSESLAARVIVAESKLLSSVMLMLNEKLTSFIKAGLRLRNAWKGFQQCADVLKSSSVKLSETDEAGIHFGLGIFNLLMSILPPRALGMVKLLGFTGDRSNGIGELGTMSLRQLTWQNHAFD